MSTGASMRRALEVCGVETNRAGYALCPFHREKTPSLKVYPDSFYCFGCGKGGDAVTFVRELRGVGFREALRLLGAQDETVPPVRRRPKPPDRFPQYLDLVRREEELLDLRRRYAPKTGDETLDERFVRACRELESVRFDILTFDFERGETA